MMDADDISGGLLTDEQRVPVTAAWQTPSAATAPGLSQESSSASAAPTAASTSAVAVAVPTEAPASMSVPTHAESSFQVDEQALIDAFGNHPAIQALPSTQRSDCRQLSSIMRRWWLGERGSAQYDPSSKKSREKDAKRKAKKFFDEMCTIDDWDRIPTKFKVGTGVLLELAEGGSHPGVRVGDDIEIERVFDETIAPAEVEVYS